jgi:taurine dioxygenase
MNMQVRPLTELIGAEIVGVDLGKPLDEATKSRLYRHFADRAVLAFRDQDFDPPRFAAAAQLFGKIIPEQFDNYRLPEYPLVSSLSNRDLEQAGERRAVRGADFHTDHFELHGAAESDGALRRRDPAERRRRYRIRLGPGRL